jgi:hypothetical protein
MSGLSNNQHQSITSRPLSSSAPGHRERRPQNNTGANPNPFVVAPAGAAPEGAAGRSRGNSRERQMRGSNQPVKSGGAIVEKREKKERSQVFSK